MSNPPVDLLGRLLGLIGLQPSKVNKTIVVLVLLAAGFLLLENMNFSGSRSQPPNSTQVTAPSVAAVIDHGGSSSSLPNDDITRYQKAIELNLKHVLSQVKGAGQLEVFVTLAAGPTMQVYESSKQTTQHINSADAGGGRQTTDSNETTHDLTLLKGTGGVEQPVVLSEIEPQIAGVLVVADGAGSYAVRLELTQATSVALGVSPGKISVLPRGGAAQ